MRARPHPASRRGDRQGGGGARSASRVDPEVTPERLQKVLSQAGLASRREAEDWIRGGRLTVNGEPATLGMKVVPGDAIRLDGRLIRQREAASGGRVFIYHRSSGESLDKPVTEEAGAEPLLLRLPRRGGRRFVVVSPMPRIDGGLELICGDGELASKLQRSVRRWTVAVSVRIRGELTEEQLRAILDGELDSGQHLTILGCESAGGEAANRWYVLTARGASGKEVRQLFERQGALVSRVLRTQLGTLTLDRSLPRGHFRQLDSGEIDALLAEPAA